MARLSESALRQMIKGGETSTVELKVAAPRPVDMTERLCGMANAQGGVVIIGVEDAEQKIVGVPDERMAMTVDTILRITVLAITSLDEMHGTIVTVKLKQVAGELPLCDLKATDAPIKTQQLVEDYAVWFANR